jgi:hypothetical protein
VEAARRLDPARLRRVIGHLQLVADPDGAAGRAERRHRQRGLWLASTLDNMVAVDGLLEPEAGQILLAALEPLTRPASAEDPRSAGQRQADALTELARRALEGGRLPQSGGVRPQLTVTVDLDSLVGGPGTLGGDTDSGPLDPEACRRLACDGALTRVLVTRHPTGHHSHEIPADHEVPSGHDVPSSHPGHDDLDDDRGLRAKLRIAAACCRRSWAAPPPSRWRSTGPAGSSPPPNAPPLAIRDRGCVFPGCARPLAWCEAHHLRHWLHGGPTDLANLALVGRAHHRAVHEGGWRLARAPDGRLTTTPPTDNTQDSPPRPDRRQVRNGSMSDAVLARW